MMHGSIPGERVQEVEPRFKLVAFDKLLLGTAPNYLVKALIPRTGLVVIWGPPKCGKSFWIFDLMMHVALMWPYRGHKVQGGAVVYLALEGAEGFKARAEAFRQRFLAENAEPVPFYLVATPFSMVADHAALIASIRAQLGETTPVAVTIDTLNRSLAGSESKDEDMAAYVKAADAIRDAFGCVVPIVHHSGIDASRPRGHTSLTGAADAQLAVKRDAAGNIAVTLEWMKDGPEGASLSSRLESVDLGLDDDGDPITSCVIVPVEGSSSKPAPARKLSDRNKLAFDALTASILDFGKPTPPSFDLPRAVRNVVDVERWREELLRKGVIEADSKNPRQDFKRMKEALAARSIIGERDGLVWIAVDGTVAATSQANLAAQAGV